MEPGLSIPKVTILSSGPDWPTSVLCGILKLSIIPILIGTIPVLTLIVPTTLAGGFMYLAAKPDSSDLEVNLATLFTAMFGLVMGLCSLVMVVCVNNVSSKRKDEIQDYEGKINPNMTLDKEVQKADAACEQAIRLSTEAVHWSRVPTCWRLGASHPTILDLLFASTPLRQGFLALAPYNLEAF